MKQLSYTSLKSSAFLLSNQVGIPVTYDEIKMDIGFRADLVVDNKVIVELKSVENLTACSQKTTLNIFED